MTDFPRLFMIFLFLPFSASDVTWQFHLLFGSLGVISLAMILLLIKDIWQLPKKEKKWFDIIFLLGFGVIAITLGGALWGFIEPAIGSGVFHWKGLIQFLASGIEQVGGFSSLFVLITLLTKVLFRRNLPRWFSEIWIVLSLGLVAICWIMMYLYLNMPTPFASDYFKLHAAIKNTCLLDPERNNCPTELVGLSYIEPEEFKRLSKYADFVYTYDAATNQYTFIARPSSEHAVVFDQRLIPIYGVDFKEYDVSTWGKDKLKNPPPFPGPWELPERTKNKDRL